MSPLNALLNCLNPNPSSRHLKSGMAIGLTVLYRSQGIVERKRGKDCNAPRLHMLR